MENSPAENMMLSFFSPATHDDCGSLVKPNPSFSWDGHMDLRPSAHWMTPKSPANTSLCEGHAGNLSPRLLPLRPTRVGYGLLAKQLPRCETPDRYAVPMGVEPYPQGVLSTNWADFDTLTEYITLAP